MRYYVSTSCSASLPSSRSTSRSLPCPCCGASRSMCDSTSRSSSNSPSHSRSRPGNPPIKPESYSPRDNLRCYVGTSSRSTSRSTSNSPSASRSRSRIRPSPPEPYLPRYNVRYYSSSAPRSTSSSSSSSTSSPSPSSSPSRPSTANFQTKNYSPHRDTMHHYVGTSDLRSRSRSRSTSRSARAAPRYQQPCLRVRFISYARSLGKPALNIPIILTVDCSKLTPPSYSLQDRYTGLDWQITDNLFSFARNRIAFDRAIEDIYASISSWTPKSGITDVAVLVRCTMGMHRSVAMAEALADKVSGWSGVMVRIEHCDLMEAVGGMEKRGYGPYKRLWRDD